MVISSRPCRVSMAAYVSKRPGSSVIWMPQSRNGNALQSTSLEGRRLVVADAIHEFADEIDTGSLDGVAECARQSGPTFLGCLRHRAITETELYTFRSARQGNQPRAWSSRCRGPARYRSRRCERRPFHLVVWMRWLCMGADTLGHAYAL